MLIQRANLAIAWTVVFHLGHPEALVPCELPFSGHGPGDFLPRSGPIRNYLIYTSVDMEHATLEIINIMCRPALFDVSHFRP